MRYSQHGVWLGAQVLAWDSSKPVRYKNPHGPHTRAVRHTLLIQDSPVLLHGPLPSSSGIRITRNDIGKLLVVDEMPDGDFVDYIVDAPTGHTFGDADPWARDYTKEAKEIVGNVRKGHPQMIQFPLSWAPAPGATFEVRKQDSDPRYDYVLAQIDPGTNWRIGELHYGKKAQTIKDVAYVLEYGTLPPPSELSELDTFGGTDEPSHRAVSCWFVVGYYAGDRPGSKPLPRGFVYAVTGKHSAQQHAARLQEEAGGQAANVIYEAVQCDRARKLFDLRA